MPTRSRADAEPCCAALPCSLALESALSRVPVGKLCEKKTLLTTNRPGELEKFSSKLQTGQSVKSEMRFQSRPYDEKVARSFRQVLAS